MSVLEIALEYLKEGLSIIPIADDKRPALTSWQAYQTRLPTEDEANEWWGKHPDWGIAVVLGSVSGNLYSFDFERKDIFQDWLREIEFEYPDLCQSMPIIDTPRGNHAYFKHQTELKRSILAKRENPEWNKKADPDERGKGAAAFVAIVELRGDRGYNLLPGSPGHCHPSGKTYKQTFGEPIYDAPEIDEKTLQYLTQCAKKFNEYVEPSRVKGVPKDLPASDFRPGTDYCKRAPWSEWKRLLEKGGWTRLKESPKKEEWRRPGKDRGPCSATLGFCNGKLGPYLYVFTTNAAPFEPDTCYSIFAVRAVIEFGNDYKKTARQCGAEGYGEPADEEIKAVVEKEIAVMRDEIQAGGGKLVGVKEAALHFVESDKSFSKIWNMKREKDFQGSLDLYLNSLLIWCLKCLITPLEMNDPDYRFKIGLRLSYEFFCQNGGERNKVLDVEYMARKLTTVQKFKNQKKELPIIQAIQDAEVGMDVETIKKWLRKIIHLEFVEFCLSESGGDHYFIMPDAVRLLLGGSENLRHARKFEEALLMLDILKYGYPGTLDPEIKKTIVWDGIVRAFFKIRIIKSYSTMADETITWIDEFLEQHGKASEEDEHGWKAGVPRLQPLLFDGFLWINVPRFREFVNRSRSNRLSDKQIVTRLQMIDDKVFKKILVGSLKNKADPIRKNYWAIPSSYFPNLNGKPKEPVTNA